MGSQHARALNPIQHSLLLGDYTFNTWTPCTLSYYVGVAKVEIRSIPKNDASVGFERTTATEREIQSDVSNFCVLKRRLFLLFAICLFSYREHCLEHHLVSCLIGVCVLL